MSGLRIVFLIGYVLILLSMLLPWVDWEIINSKMMGYETDGLFVGIIGIAAFVFGLAYKNGKRKNWFPLIGSIISLALVFLIYSRHIRACLDIFLDEINLLNECYVSAGDGIFIAGLGSILMLIGSAFALRETPESG